MTYVIAAVVTFLVVFVTIAISMAADDKTNKREKEND